MSSLLASLCSPNVLSPNADTFIELLTGGGGKSMLLSSRTVPI